MKRNAMFMDWKIQHSKNVSSSQTDIRFNKIPIKISVIFFGDVGKIILKFTWKDKGTNIMKTFVKKEE